MKLGLIIEGHGEVLAAPALATRIAHERLNRYSWVVQEKPMRIKRGKFAARFDEYERALTFLATNYDSILVILDSDDDDPDALRIDLETRARDTVGHRRVEVAPAVKMWEAWFLASLPSIRGNLDMPADAPLFADPEGVRGAAGRFRSLLSTGIYSKSVDQKTYTALIDFDVAESNSPSFRRLLACMERLTA